MAKKDKDKKKAKIVSAGIEFQGQSGPFGWISLFSR
jgi:hypothetical protein